MRQIVQHLRGNTTLTIEKAKELNMRQGEIAIKESTDGFSELYVLSADGESLSTFSSIPFNLSLVYPVGSIYLSVNSTNPSVLFGFGEWEQIKDRFLLAAGSKYSAGATGGAATHTLTAKQLPKQEGTISTHGVYSGTPIAQVSGVFTATHSCEDKYMTGSASGHSSVDTIKYSNGGEGAAHNNMPPYLTVYVWKRVG